MAQAVNNFTLTGNISRKPEIKSTSNGKKYAFISIAVNGLNKDKADFFSFVIWEKLAENICNYCNVGDCISVHGYISSVPDQSSQYDKAMKLQLTADAVTFLHKAQKKSAEPMKIEPERDTFVPASVDPFAPF